MDYRLKLPYVGPPRPFWEDKADNGDVAHVTFQRESNARSDGHYGTSNQAVGVYPISGG
jgi:hypothetical protein